MKESQRRVCKRCNFINGLSLEHCINCGSKFTDASTKLFDINTSQKNEKED